jgi:hypothetical protein
MPLEALSIGPFRTRVCAVEDIRVDDEDGAIRHVIVDTGNWLSGRKVLISPRAIGHLDWMGQLLPSRTVPAGPRALSLVPGPSAARDQVVARIVLAAAVRPEPRARYSIACR